MIKKRYELHLLIEYEGDSSWIYYNRYKTYDGAVAALEAQGKALAKNDMFVSMGKIRDAEDGSVSFYTGGLV